MWYTNQGCPKEELQKRVSMGNSIPGVSGSVAFKVPGSAGKAG
jgi:hypothetical protein